MREITVETLPISNKLACELYATSLIIELSFCTFVRTWENKVGRISSYKFDSCLGAWLNVTNKGTQTVFFFFCNINIFLIQTYVLTFTQYKKLYSDLPARGS